MRIIHVIAIFLALISQGGQAEPIRLHPENPHYFEFQGKPTILLTSAEHYGAVMNLDFDYIKYLDALKAGGGNYTRTFSGAYREIPGSFNIQHNTLAPVPGRYVCPWARSGEDGYAIGGKKFDLARWDPAYFERLKDFVAQAGRRGIVVELSLFCPFYPQKQGVVDVLWKASPMNAANNVNGIGTCAYDKANTLENGNLLAAQEAMVRKIVEELNGFDNVFYEICNEPYFGGVTLEWQQHIAGVITGAEKKLPKKHLIAQNIANHHQKIEKPDPQVSIFNFHYARPSTVTDNLGLNRALGDDETGFRGSEAEPYRVEAWQFLLAGGALYNNLDYTFTMQSPEGRDTANKAPGSTTVEIRDQLAVLRKFMNGIEFIKMRPMPAGAIKSSAGLDVHALALEGKLVAAYFAVKVDKGGKAITPDSVSAAEKTRSADGKQARECSIELPAGKWQARWISPLDGKTVKRETLNHKGGRATLKMPAMQRDVALRLERVTEQK